MKKLLVLFILAFAIKIGSAQDAQFGMIEGLVFERETGARLQGVNVTLLGTSQGDATDAEGFFKIERVPPGQSEIEVRLIGFTSKRLKLEVVANKSTEISLELERKVLKGAEVAVEGERAEDIRLEITRPSFELAPKEIQGMAGAQEDVMRSVLSLPGVQATSDFGNQFIVRGGGPDQNLILLDGVEIFNPYRNSGMPSLINPAIVGDVKLYAGGYPAFFGDRLSSVLTIHTRDGSNTESVSGAAGINLTSANLLLEGKTPFWNGSWLLSSRSTYNQLFATDFAERLTANEVAFPDFQDWHAKVTLQPGGRNRLQLHGIVGQNKQDFLVKEELGEQDTERENLDGEDRIKSYIVGASWDHIVSANVQAKLFANWYRIRGNSDFAANFIPANHGGVDDTFGIPPIFPGGDFEFAFAHDQRFDFQKLSFGGWLLRERRNHVTEAGFGFDFLKSSITSELETRGFGETVFEALQTAPNFFGALNDSVNQRRSYERFHFYGQDKWTILDGRAYVQPGFRFDYYDLIERGFFSPRVKISYQLDALTSLTGSWGIYRQSPGFEKLLDGGRVFDLLKFEDLAGLSPEKAFHTLIGVQRRLGDAWHLTAEGYHKKFDDLIDQSIELVDSPFARYSSGSGGLPLSYRIEQRQVYRRVPKPANDVKGIAYGIDLRLEKRVTNPSDRFSGWFSYSFGKSTRQQAFEDAVLSRPYEFDRRHSIDLVANLRLTSNLTVSATWRYGTGFPYTPALSVEPLVAQIAPNPEDPETVVASILTDSETGFVRFVPTFGGPENINSARYPAYRRLDARITYSRRMLSARWHFYLDFINILNRRNVLIFRSIIQTEVDTSLPQSLQFVNVRAFEEPIYMYPFIPSFGFRVDF